jgi:xanthine dehydrogenase accessory factor
MPGFQPFHAMLAAIASREPFALGIISGVKGSSPQKRGAKALFFADGRIEGTLGGGCLEAEVRERALVALRKGTTASFELVLDHDFGWDDGLVCGGKVCGLILPEAAAAEAVWRRLAPREKPLVWGVRNDFSIGLREESDGADWRHIETVSPPHALWIAGGGHVARAVAPLAEGLDFQVSVFDDRAALLQPGFFPAGTTLRSGFWEDLLQGPFPAQPAFGLIVTRGHQHDALALRHWIQRPFAFLGMIGSSRKRRLIFSRLVEDGMATREQLDLVACPVGLDIQAVSVPEIAVSIMAQLVRQRAAMAARKVMGRPEPKFEEGWRLNA